MDTIRIDHFGSLGLQKRVSGEETLDPLNTEWLRVTTFDIYAAGQLPDLLMGRGNPQGLLNAYPVGQTILLRYGESLIVLVSH